MQKATLTRWNAVGGLASQHHLKVVCIMNILSQDPSALEAQLMRRVAQGNRAAFGALYDLYASRLYSLAVCILTDPQEAESVLQEISLMIWQNASNCEATTGNMFNWAVALTRNQAICHLRARQSRRRPTDGSDIDETFCKTQTISSCGSHSEARSGTPLDELPIDERTPIKLAFFSGLPLSEIAGTLNEPTRKVKENIRKGMLRLREMLESQVETPGVSGGQGLTIYESE